MCLFFLSLSLSLHSLRQVKKLKSEMAGQPRVLPQPALSASLPHARPLPLPLPLPPDACPSPRALSPALLARDSGPGPQTPTPQQPSVRSPSPEAMELVPGGDGLGRSVETLTRSVCSTRTYQHALGAKYCLVRYNGSWVSLLLLNATMANRQHNTLKEIIWSDTARP